MGWQDRDWAKLNDAEKETLYGVSRPASPRRLVLPVPRRRTGLPWTAWLAIVLAGPAIGVGVGMLQDGLTHHATHGGAPAVAAVLYGIQGTNTADPYGPNGIRAACTDEWVDTSGRWQCESWSLDTTGLPIVAPHQYDGVCAHALVDQDHGRWVCVSVRLHAQT